MHDDPPPPIRVGGTYYGAAATDQLVSDLSGTAARGGRRCRLDSPHPAPLKAPAGLFQTFDDIHCKKGLNSVFFNLKLVLMFLMKLLPGHYTVKSGRCS